MNPWRVAERVHGLEGVHDAWRGGCVVNAQRGTRERGNGS